MEWDWFAGLREIFPTQKISDTNPEIFMPSFFRYPKNIKVVSPIFGRSRDAISNAQRDEHEVSMIQWAPCH